MTNEYRQVTEDLPYIASLYGELINATRQGADVQPMHFNAQAYHDSKIYQIQDEMKKETHNYLHDKKQQEKARQMEEEKEIKDRAWKHLPIEQKIERIKLDLKYGAGKMVMDTVTGVGYMFRHPIRTAEAFMHWNQTSAYLAQGIQESFDKNMVHGDASTRSQWIGYASATIASFFIGTKGLDKVSKVGRAAEAIESVENVSKTAKVAKTIGKGAGQSSRIETDEISTAALQQLTNASKAGKLPYNVINTVKLRNQLRKITQRSTGGYSYDLVSQVEKQKLTKSIKECVTKVAGTEKPHADKYMEKHEFKNVGEYFNYINDIGRRDDLASAEKFEKIHEAYAKLKTKGDVTIVSDMKFLKPEGFVDGRMNVDWPDKMGFKAGSIRPINRNNPLPEKWDRVGGRGGENFTTLSDNGIPYTYDQRAIPYIENPSARHAGIFSNESYFDAIDAIKNENLEELNQIVVANGKDLISEVDFDRFKAAYNDYQDRIRKNFGKADFTYGLRGTAASWISSSTEEKLMSGGAEQIVTPLNAQTLEMIGVIPKY